MRELEIRTSLATADLPWTSFAKVLQSAFLSQNFSSDWLKWKHLENPAGPSIVAWASEGDIPCAFRAFWRVPLLRGEEPMVAYQPCETAVSPDFQRRGLFGEMTKAARDLADRLGVSLLFNFPNQKSVGGYLKLGWKRDLELARYLRICRPMRLVRLSSVTPWWKMQALPTFPVSKVVREDFSERFWPRVESKKALFNVSPEYLSWRFLDNPSCQYGAIRIQSERLIYKVLSFGDVRAVELLGWSGRSVWNFNAEFLQGVRYLEAPDIISCIDLRQKEFHWYRNLFFRGSSSINYLSHAASGLPLFSKPLFEPMLIDTM